VIDANLVEKEHTDIGLTDNIHFVRISGQIATLINGSRVASRSGNTELPGSRSFVWFFGASYLGNQTFNLQNLRDT